MLFPGWKGPSRGFRACGVHALCETAAVLSFFGSSVRGYPLPAFATATLRRWAADVNRLSQALYLSTG